MHSKVHRFERYRSLGRALHSRTLAQHYTC